MKILVYSTKPFEVPYLEKSNHLHLSVEFCEKALTSDTAILAKGHDCISTFTNDDLSAEILRELHAFGVKYIAVRAAGYDNVNLKEAEFLGIHVANVPEYSPYAIAEHAMAMILALVRKLVVSDKQVHLHNFTLDNLVGFDLNKKTVGIVGAGRIGGILARIAHGFGCEVLAYDINPTSELSQKYDVKFCSLEELSQKSDVISIHAPLNDQTRHMFDAKLFSSMKKGVIVVNTSRGAVVDTAALLTHLNNGIVGAYGMDVYEKERGVFFFDHSKDGINDPVLQQLMQMNNVLITPHQAFATNEALTNIADTTFANIIEWNAGLTPDTELTHFSPLLPV